MTKLLKVGTKLKTRGGAEAVIDAVLGDDRCGYRYAGRILPQKDDLRKFSTGWTIDGKWYPLAPAESSHDLMLEPESETLSAVVWVRGVADYPRVFCSVDGARLALSAFQPDAVITAWELTVRGDERGWYRLATVPVDLDLEPAKPGTAELERLGVGGQSKAFSALDLTHRTLGGQAIGPQVAAKGFPNTPRASSGAAPMNHTSPSPQPNPVKRPPASPETEAKGHHHPETQDHSQGDDQRTDTCNQNETGKAANLRPLAGSTAQTEPKIVTALFDTDAGQQGFTVFGREAIGDLVCYVSDLELAVVFDRPLPKTGTTVLAGLNAANWNATRLGGRPEFAVLYLSAAEAADLRNYIRALRTLSETAPAPTRDVPGDYTGHISTFLRAWRADWTPEGEPAPGRDIAPTYELSPSEYRALGRYLVRVSDCRKALAEWITEAQEFGRG